MSGCGAHDAHLRHMDDLFAACRAIGRADFILHESQHVSADERLVLIGQVIADLSRDLRISNHAPATSTDGSNL